mmetsp:Transcript_7566/g.13994  ORF Transcript_7566/g.13994 Transcript_7566/m.13994 type:complete len:347 (+) Transcript_7566:88-1128(+)
MVTCDKAAVDSTSKAKARYESLLNELGIQGLDARTELRAKASEELPLLHGELVTLLQQIGDEILTYYEAHAKRAAGTTETKDGKTRTSVAPMWRAFLHHGPHACIEVVESEVPGLHKLRQAAAQRAANKNAEEPTALTVSKGDDVGGISFDVAQGETTSLGGQAESGGISWDIQVEDGGVAGGEQDGGINWGVEVAAEGTAATPAAGDGGTDGIDWGSVAIDGIELGVQGEAVVTENGAGTQAMQGSGLLADSEVRELLYQDIIELKAFLRERCEQHGGSDENSGLQGSEELSRDKLDALLDVTVKAEELLAGKKARQFLLMLSSDKCLERHVQRVEVAKNAARGA